MSDYQVDDEYTCKKDFHMVEGERVFTAGNVYTIIQVCEDDEEHRDVDVMLTDDDNDEHYMDDNDMKEYFVLSKQSKKTDSPADAYDRAMGIL